MSPVAIWPAALPLVAAALAVGSSAVTGLSQASALPPEVESRFYGFFLNQYPLFTFAVVYGLARIAVIAATGRASPVRRVIGTGLGAVLLLALSVHPTFGGVILRAGFATGGMTFLTFQPMSVAYALGAAASAFVFGGALMTSRLLIGGDATAGSWRRRLVVALCRAGAGYLALWFAFAVIGAAHSAGFGPWPRRAMWTSEAGMALALVVVGFLPHAVLVWLSLRANSRPASATA